MYPRRNSRRRERKSPVGDGQVRTIHACGCCRRGSIWLEENRGRGTRTARARHGRSVTTRRLRSAGTNRDVQGAARSRARGVQGSGRSLPIARRTADADRDDRGGARPSRRRARQLRARAGGGPQGAASRPTTSRGCTRTTGGSTRRSSSRPSRRRKCGSAPRPRTRSGGSDYRKGLATHAVAAFDRALSKAPDNPVYHYHLGLAQLKAGNTRQGRAALTRALALKSDFNGADEAREHWRNK